MSEKITGINQNYNCLDYGTLRDSLELGDVEAMDDREMVRHAFVKQGSIPNKIAKAEASDFGLRHAFFDVWKPVDENKTGVWMLEKDADGNEWIVRAEK